MKRHIQLHHRNWWILLILPWNAIAGTIDETIVWFQSEAELTFSKASPDTHLEYALDGGAMQPAPDPFLAPTSGTHWLAVSRRDASGNVSAPAWFHIGIDAFPPQVSIVLSKPTVKDPSGVEWVPGETKAWVEATDADSGIARSALECNGCATSGEQSIVLGRSGAVSLTAWAEDRVGHRSESNVLELKIDAQNPTGELIIHGARFQGENGLFLAPDSTINAQFVDGESGIDSWIALRNETEIQKEVWKKPLPDGKQSVSAIVNDRVGNQAKIGPLVFTTDGSPPKIDWDLQEPAYRDPQGRPWFGKGPAAVKAIAKDSGVGIKAFTWTVEGIVPADGSRWQSVTGTLQVDAQTLYLKAVDHLGNVSDQLVKIPRDREAPKIQIIPQEATAFLPDDTIRVTANQKVTVAFDDTGCGLSQRCYRIEEPTAQADPEKSICVPSEQTVRISMRSQGKQRSTEFSPVATAKNGDLIDQLTFEEPGSYRIEIEARDFLDNETIRTFTFEVPVFESEVKP